MNYRNIIIILFCLFGLLTAQAQGFKGTAIIGLNASQLDGDNLYGFKKLGLSIGGRISYQRESTYDLALEMLYSQRGSSVQVFNALPNEKISLNYFELPLVFSLRDWYIEDQKYYKVRAEAGLSYGYLFGITAEGYEEAYFRKHDVSWLAGVGLNLTKSIGFGLRYTASFPKLYKDPTVATSQLLGYFLTLRSEITF